MHGLAHFAPFSSLNSRRFWFKYGETWIINVQGLGRNYGSTCLCFNTCVESEHTWDKGLISAVMRAVIISTGIQSADRRRSAPGFARRSSQPAAAEQGTGAPSLLALFASSPAPAPTVCAACGWGAGGTTRSAPRARLKKSYYPSPGCICEPFRQTWLCGRRARSFIL